MTKDYEKLNEAGKEFVDDFISKVVLKDVRYYKEAPAELVRQAEEEKRKQKSKAEVRKAYEDDCEQFFEKFKNDSMGWEREQYLEMLFPLFECMSMDKVRYFYLFIAGSLHIGSKKQELGLDD